MNTTNPRTMQTDARGQNITPVIDLPYGSGLLRLTRDGVMDHIREDGSREPTFRKSKLDRSLLSAEDLATFDAWDRDQDRYGA